MFHLVARVDIASIRMIFWDLGGQEDLQSLWDKVSGGTGVVEFWLKGVRYH